MNRREPSKEPSSEPRLPGTGFNKDSGGRPEDQPPGEGRGLPQSPHPPSPLPLAMPEGEITRTAPARPLPGLAPQLTPTQAASSGFPNRSQVWARCPGRKWGAGPHQGQHSRPAAPAMRQAWSQQLGGATHVLPKSPGQSPCRGSLQKQILFAVLFKELAALGRKPRQLHPQPCGGRGGGKAGGGGGGF